MGPPLLVTTSVVMHSAAAWALWDASVLKCEVTVGQAEGDKWPYGGTVGAVEAYGGRHVPLAVEEVCVDAANRVYTSPAYMYDGAPHEIHASVGNLVASVLQAIPK